MLCEIQCSGVNEILSSFLHLQSTFEKFDTENTHKIVFSDYNCPKIGAVKAILYSET